MPTSLQEWIALGLVGLTLGYLLGRWWARRSQGASDDCQGCPEAKAEPQQFKNIPINVAKKPTLSDK